MTLRASEEKTSHPPVSHLRRYGRAYKTSSPTRHPSTTLRVSEEKQVTRPSYIYDVTVARTKQAQSPVTRP